MRIFQLAPVFGTAGGTETYAAWLSERLISMGHQTAMAAAAIHAARPNNYQVAELPELAWRDVADPVTGRQRIREVVRDFRPDCVLLHGVGDGPLLRMLQGDYLTVECETPARSQEPGTHLIYVGRTVYVKGIQYLIRALGLLDREYDLTIVGDGWYLAALKDLTERLGLGPRVTFRGGLQGADLIRACRFADVAVVPSIYPEPSGLVVPELRSLGI